ncbi:MAG: hypothetical protein HPY57_09575 [Ignavibacteria bacterium]|nr:hypothetical protein [Ignavibacteria bacterium]
MKKKIVTLIFLILSYNIVFLLQDLFDSELQIYLLGFRFNLFFLVNCIVIYFHRTRLIELKKYFNQIGRLKAWFISFVIPVFISALTLILIYALGYSFKFKKPEFLIEFGVSSLVDLPIYYIWNLPLLLSSLFVITLILEDFKFLKVFGVCLLLSLSFISAKPVFTLSKFNPEYFSFLALVFAVLFYNLTIFKIYNSIWLTIFSVLISIYSFVLVFGSNNTFLIKTFFARMYSSWNGLFVFKKLDVYLIDLLFAGLMIIFAFLFFIFDKKKSNNL